MRPCRSITARLPAARCSPSTFWVITPCTTPACSSAATARCPAFGSARAIRAQPTWLRAQYRRCAAGPETNSVYVIGVRRGEPGPR